MGVPVNDVGASNGQHVGRGLLGKLLVLGSATDLLRHCLAVLRHAASWTDYRGVERKKSGASHDGGIRGGDRLLSIGGRDLPQPAWGALRVTRGQRDRHRWNESSKRAHRGERKRRFRDPLCARGLGTIDRL